MVEYNFEIYQLDIHHHEKAAYMLYMGLNENASKRRYPERNLYRKVYSATLRGTEDEDITGALEEIYAIFNIYERMPEDYNARCLSVSDVVVINGTAYYCDNIGFKALPKW